jgi:translocation and assembly module TamB
MIRRLPRWGRWLLILLVVLVVIYLILYAVLTSRAFSRFVLNRVESAVPELAFRDVQGSFTQGLRFDFRYASGDTRVQAGQTRVVIVPDCLWQLAACIDTLEVQELLVNLPPAQEDAAEAPAGEPAPDGEPQLPEIQLPLDVSIQEISIASLIVTRGGDELYRMSGLDSELVWRNSTLEIERLTGTDAYCQWALAGEVTFINRYPLNLELACASETGYGQVQAEIAGDLAQLGAELQALITSDYTAEPAPVRASLTLAPLREQLPAALRLQTEEDIRLLFGDQSAELRSSLITAEGPLLSPTIEARLQFESPFWPGQNALRLQADASTEALNISSMSLDLPEGQVNAQGRLSYGEALAWTGDLNWQNVDLSQFGEAFSGQLNGSLSSEASNVEGDWRAHVALESVSGDWLGRRLSASGELDWRDDTLTVEDLQVQQGQNRVAVAGTFSPDQRLDMAATLEVPNLRHLIPATVALEAGGQIRGDIRFAGTLDNLAINSDLTATDLRYNDLQLASGDLQLEWFGISERRGQLSLNLNELAVAENLAADITLTGRGNVDQHTLELQITGLRDQIDRDLALQCSGGFADAQAPPGLEHWQGRCTELKLALSLADQAQTWTLASPFAVEAWPQQPAVTVESFCLTNEGARICNRELIRFADGELSDLLVTGSDLPVTWLEPLLPGEDLSTEGAVSFRFEASHVLEDLQLSAELSSDDLAMRWAPAGQDPVGVQVTDLTANWALAGEQHDISWRLQTEESGSTRGEVTITGEQIAGDLVINELELGSYSKLLLGGPQQTLTGEVNAGLEVAGTLQDPVLTGEVIVDGGTFTTEQLPVPLRDIYLNLEIANNRAVAQGNFRAAESEGDISGQFTWGEQTWSGELNVSAEPLQVRPEPDVQLTIAPDLQFKFSPGQLSIDGQVRVPTAQIELTELPEQAVGVSPDTVIVDDDEELAEVEEGTGLEINTNVELVLGDKVQFEGFGLETRITGRLRLQQQTGGRLRANGKLQLVEGRYEAYGQNLVIRSGDLVFVGDIDNPQLRVEAIRADTPEDVVVGLRASGPARSPQVSLFSNPDMPQQAQLSFLLTGNPPGTQVETDPELAAAEAALSYALESDLGSGITRRAGQALGIEDLQVTAGATEEGTQIGLSGYITPNLLVRYGVGVFDAINTLTLRYQMTKNVYLEAMSGEGSDVGVMWSFERD